MRNPTYIVFRLAAVVTVGLSLHVLTALDFEGAQTITLDGFETRAVNPDGKTEWELRGQTAKLRGGLYDLSDIRLAVHLEDGRRVDLASPRCTFDHARGIVRSDAPLEVVSADMALAGVGYDLAIDRNILRIRSQVRMTLRKLGTRLVPSDVFGNLDHRPRQDDGEEEPANKPRENEP